MTTPTPPPGLPASTYPPGAAKGGGLWRRLTLAAFVSLVTILTAEVSLQIFYFATVGQWLFTRTGLPLFVPDDRFVYWNKPNLHMTHRTNEFQSELFTNGQGFRVPEHGADYPPAKRPGTERVMLLGPSFAFGWGVDYEQSFAAHLQQLMNEHRAAGAPEVELINAGVPSMGPALNLDWYRAVGKDYAPDVVIQLIYTTMAVPRVGNRNDISIDDAGYLVRRNTTARQRLTAYAKRSALVFYGWMASVRARGAMSAPPEGGAILGAGREAKMQKDFDPTQPETAEAIEYYQDLRKTVEASGAKLMIMFVPLSYCVHPEDVARWSHLGVHDVDTQREYDENFCRYLRDQGFDCFNTTDALRAAAAAGQRLYYLVDIHWTPAGNDVTAHAVFDHLQAEQAAVSGKSNE